MRCSSISLARKDTGVISPRKNGPALAGYGALTMKDALAKAVTPLPKTLRRSLTWDRGKELSAHALFTEQTGVPVYFADAKSPWQRGSNEHLNGLLRQYFPKGGTDLSRWSSAEIAAVANVINNRPRGILDWRTPPRKCSKNSYDLHNYTLLRRRVEYAQYTSIAFTDRLIEVGIDASIGATGSSYDNALAETINGLYKTELIKPRGPWRTVEHVEIATLEWVDWFNHRRLYEHCGGCASCRTRGVLLR